jgi:hypothetical protein
MRCVSVSRYCAVRMTPGHNIAQSSACGSSPPWELDGFYDFIDFGFFLIICNPTGGSPLFTPTLYVCEIISSSRISLCMVRTISASVQSHQISHMYMYQFPPSAVLRYCKPIIQNPSFHIPRDGLLSHPVQTKSSPRNVITRHRLVFKSRYCKYMQQWPNITGITDDRLS